MFNSQSREEIFDNVVCKLKKDPKLFDEAAEIGRNHILQSDILDPEMISQFKTALNKY